MSVSNFHRDHEQGAPQVSSVMPEAFKVCMLDFVRDLSLSFGEYAYMWCGINADTSEQDWNYLYAYCARVYPAALMTILYESEGDMQDMSNQLNAEFLPFVNFRMIFNAEGVTGTIKSTIWKYLQAILYILIPSIESSHALGMDVLAVLETMDESVLAAKLAETAQGLSAFWKFARAPPAAADGCAMNVDGAQRNETPAGPSFPFEDLPRAEAVNGRLHDLMGGKLGKFAAELAAEFQAQFASNPEMAACTSPAEMMAYLGRNPVIFASIIRTMSARLSEKIRRGEINREEIKEELDKLVASFCDMNPAEMETTLATMSAAGYDVSGIKEAVRREQARRRMAAKAAGGGDAKRARAPVPAPVDPYAGLSKFEKQQRRKIDREREQRELDDIAAFINS